VLPSVYQITLCVFESALSTRTVTNILLVGSIVVVGKTKSVCTSTDVTESFHPIKEGVLIISGPIGVPELLVNCILT
jgi:hypothetical protein